MSIKKSPLFAATLFTATLVSAAAFAQTPGVAAPQIQKPVPPVATAVAPVPPATAAAPLAENAAPAATTTAPAVTPSHAQYQKMKQEHDARFKPLTSGEQAHIAATHEHAARQRYYHDIHNLNNLTPQQRADMKQELGAWFSALPLERQVDLKRRDEILFGKDEYHRPAPAEKKAQKPSAEKQKMQIMQITTTPGTDTMTKTIIKTVPPQGTTMPPAAPTAATSQAAVPAAMSQAAAPAAAPQTIKTAPQTTTAPAAPHGMPPIPVTP